MKQIISYQRESLAQIKESIGGNNDVVDKETKAEEEREPFCEENNRIILKSDKELTGVPDEPYEMKRDMKDDKLENERPEREFNDMVECLVNNGMSDKELSKLSMNEGAVKYGEIMEIQQLKGGELK